ncbi:hypothetical protein K435DRAFT_799284 [Dendrothele bispora CBS 962.96]|uniref:Uncharacterized protein n=1 Tax=Dendrothele bispora (strain CBS 962.96) TaxID=1314807 RepID=A0A4S8LWD3_DENBC|nr:hypothetical protein K435DRAFT_799284 [Dendrothele bispora CBS 962.96]
MSLEKEDPAVIVFGVDWHRGLKVMTRQVFQGLEVIAGTVVLITDYVLLVPLAYTAVSLLYLRNALDDYPIRYQIPSGPRDVLYTHSIGAPLDRIFVTYCAARGGVWYPEDRLHGTLIGTGLFVPDGFILCVVSLFFNGISVDLVYR